MPLSVLFNDMPPICLAETAHRCRIQNLNACVLHSWKEGYESGWGSQERLWDCKHCYKTASEKSKDITWDLHPDCKWTAFHLISKEYLAPQRLWIKIPVAHLDASWLAYTCSHTHLFRNYPVFQQHVNVTICCHTPQVAGVPMTVLTASIIFEKKWLVTQIDAAAACPTAEGNAHV